MPLFVKFSSICLLFFLRSRFVKFMNGEGVREISCYLVECLFFSSFNLFFPGVFCCKVAVIFLGGIFL